MNMALKRLLRRLPISDENGIAPIARRCRWPAVICVLMLGGLQLSSGPSRTLGQPLESNGTTGEEPIRPIPAPQKIDPLKIKLGEGLFGDPRLSHDNSRSCSSCHDLGTNGATTKDHDVGLDGSSLPLNTPTVFNVALSFRFGWEGKFRTLESDTKASLENPQIMGASLSKLAEKLAADPNMRRQFTAVYGNGPDATNIVDAITSFERTLVTPGSRFDRWLEGDAAALSTEELSGYRLFKFLGCVSCHQGVNIGGNLFERHGIFHPLASPQPEILRVPSLRNVATTPPYFHDGSAQTLDDAVRKMGLAQLNSTLTDQQVKAIVAYLQTLTGNYRGTPGGALP
jgi:cytochrome c peroxidase